MAKEIKVVIVDDHDLFRQGITSILSNGDEIQVTGAYSGATELLENLEKQEADLILLDVDMPGINGIEAACELKVKYPHLKIIMLSMHQNFSTFKEAMASGVNGYLLKTSDKEEVKNAIRQVMGGEDYFAQKVKDVLLGSFKAPDNVNTVELTPREREVLSLVCQELSTNEIAERLFISSHTVETHRRSLLSKTGCKNSIGLLKFAMENDLI